MIPEHGGNLRGRSDLLDFSANINPLGLPHSVKEAVTASVQEWTHYPDPDCTALTAALSANTGFPAEQIVCGNGAADLIYRIVHALHPHHALICAPTFSEYEHALLESGCEISFFNLTEQNSFRLSDEILNRITPDIDLLFLCTPNNPTGLRIEPELLAKIAMHCDKNNTVFVCDECFLAFSEQSAAYSLKSCMNPSCIILNAFTKIYAMPGIRLGFICCGSKELAAKIRQSGQFWSVSVPAQAAGIAALQDAKYLSRTVRYVAEERAFLTDSLRKCGIHVYRSDANFLMLRTNSQFAESMLKAGIIIRQCANFRNLDESYFRIAVRTNEENCQLIRAVKEAFGL